MYCRIHYFLWKNLVQDIAIKISKLVPIYIYIRKSFKYNQEFGHVVMWPVQRTRKLITGEWRGDIAMYTAFKLVSTISVSPSVNKKYRYLLHNVRFLANKSVESGEILKRLQAQFLLWVKPKCSIGPKRSETIAMKRFKIKAIKCHSAISVNEGNIVAVFKVLIFQIIISKLLGSIKHLSFTLSRGIMLIVSSKSYLIHTFVCKKTNNNTLCNR